MMMNIMMMVTTAPVIITILINAMEITKLMKQLLELKILMICEAMTIATMIHRMAAI